MSEQRTFASVAWQQKKKVTRRERFLAECDAVIPWARFVRLVAPHYPKPGRGRRPIGVETMLRIYFLQQWFNLSDPQAEEMLYDSEAMRRFARLELSEDAIPDESTILRFRHLLEAHHLPAQLFETVRRVLSEQQLLLQTGTIVDATIISAPSSTKNAAQARDPEMRQTRKGNQWYFGMKLHVGTDRRGLVHSVQVTDAAVADITQLPALLHGREREVFGDQAYWSAAVRARCTQRGLRFRVNRRGKLTAQDRATNRARSRVRVRVETPFLIVKHLWGFTKARYRGLAKNAARAYTMLALANLYLVRHLLRPPGTQCA